MSDFLMQQGSNDLALTNGDLSVIDGAQAIAQDIKQTLQFFYGEWFLNNQLGIPWFQSILIKNVQIDSVNAILQNAILAVPGVVQLISFNLNFQRSIRNLTIQTSVQVTNGEIISVSVPVGV